VRGNALRRQRCPLVSEVHSIAIGTNGKVFEMVRSERSAQACLAFRWNQKEQKPATACSAEAAGDGAVLKRELKKGVDRGAAHALIELLLQVPL